MFLLLAVQARGAAPDERSASNVELEFQRFRVDNNEIQRPNSRRGTRFEATDFTADTGNSVRLNMFVPLDWRQPRDELRVVIAPLTLSGRGISPKPITYEQATFEAGAPLNVDYRFNTYRFTYLVPICPNAFTEGWDLRAGATVAMRDAKIKLSQGAVVREFSNVGPIPLLYMSATKALRDRWRLVGEFDAFPAPGGGGLFDGSLKVAFELARDFDLTVGVRYQVGAAEDPEIFNSLREVVFATGIRATF